MCVRVPKLKARSDCFRNCNVLSQPPAGCDNDSGRSQGKNSCLAVWQDYSVHAHHDVLFSLLPFHLLLCSKHNWLTVFSRINVPNTTTKKLPYTQLLHKITASIFSWCWCDTKLKQVDLFRTAYSSLYQYWLWAPRVGYRICSAIRLSSRWIIIFLFRGRYCFRQRFIIIWLSNVQQRQRPGSVPPWWYRILPFQ